MVLPDLTNQFIADSYKGILHTSNVPVSGNNLPPVYDGLGNKTSLSIGALGISVSGTLSATGLDLSIINSIFPVGSIWFSINNVNPSSRFVGSTWERIAEGRFLVGVGTGNDGVSTYSMTDGNTGGTYEHTLTIDEMPPHAHSYRGAGGGGAVRRRRAEEPRANQIDSITSSTGGGESHNNTPPGFGLYIWERTS